MFRHVTKNFTKICVPFDELTLEWYRQIMFLRVEGLIVNNKRCIQVVDDYDHDAWFNMVWHNGILVAVNRTRWPDKVTVGYDGQEYFYPICDRAVVIDPRVSLFPPSKSEICLHSPDWYTSIYGAANGMFTVYKEVASLFDKLPYMKRIGENVDEYGFPGYIYVIETMPKEDADYIFKHERTERLEERRIPRIYAPHG